MWTSLTRQFSKGEMERIRTTSTDDLLECLLESDSVVALRLMAELLIRSKIKDAVDSGIAGEKFLALAKNQKVIAHCRNFYFDQCLTWIDQVYFDLLIKEAEAK